MISKRLKIFHKNRGVNFPLGDTLGTWKIRNSPRRKAISCFGMKNYYLWYFYGSSRNTYQEIELELKRRHIG